jgi:hypothetical protein
LYLLGQVQGTKCAVYLLTPFPVEDYLGLGWGVGNSSPPKLGFVENRVSNDSKMFKKHESLLGVETNFAVEATKLNVKINYPESLIKFYKNVSDYT